MTALQQAALRWFELQRDAVADPMTGLRAEPEHTRQAEGQAARKRGLCLNLAARKQWKLVGSLSLLVFYRLTFDVSGLILTP